MRHLIVALALLAAASPAAAQVRGIPVYNSGVPWGIGFMATSVFPSSFNPDGPAGSDVSVGVTATGAARSVREHELAPDVDRMPRTHT
jgi:hypothetical protein